MTDENREAIEQMIRGADKADEPGEIVKDRIVHKGDLEQPAPMVALPVESAGYTWVYDTKTGVHSKVNNNMLPRTLQKKRPDGSYIFTLKRPKVMPKQGIYKCLLHKDDPNRAHYDVMGFAVCPKGNLSSPFHVRRHMKARHKVEWEAIEAERLEAEKKEEREFQRSLLGKASEKAPLYVSEKDKKKGHK